MKTLLLVLVSTGKSRGARESTIWGLVGVDKDAIRKGLIEGRGAKGIVRESRIPGYSSLAEITVVFRILFCLRLPPDLALYDLRMRFPLCFSIEVAYTLEPCR